MTQYDNNMTAVLFRNTEKLTDNHPDWKGSAEINGERFWLSGWDKTTKRGETISIKIEPAKKAQDAMPKQTPADEPFFDDEIPY